MGLFASKRNYVALQNTIFNLNEKKMVVSQSQLMNGVKRYISNHLRIINDCAQLINTTKNPDIFLKRFQLLKEQLSDLIKIESFGFFQKPYPSKQLQVILTNYNESVNRLADRIIDDTLEKCKKTKTIKAKNKKISNACLKFINYDFPMSCKEYMKNLMERNMFTEQ